ncbi:hypothetical protein A6V39_04320 [Candidatus Mycoplasma haematobovis]|uniref:Uncharacterized protein n=1 Tax=Candidatus Mycoplasma haematobovis TaxID=432608 RepID=A0A1A9QDP2_9MOLU|nr:hypothetical protein [Candidatus Mycoplasma haematobovis]OAL10111.1 hypothetical protein A6V39_04320 [Candidatus Mycoplasma haematobovis]
MRVRFKKPLIVLGSAGAVGGAGYYAFSRWSSDELTVAPKVSNAPKWFNKLKNSKKESLPVDLQAAQIWTKLGDTPDHQRVASNWIELFCSEEPKPSNNEYCNKENIN